MKVFILAIFVSCASTTNATTTSVESTTLSGKVSYPSDDYYPNEEIKTYESKYGTPAAKRQFPHVAFLKSRNAFKVQYCSGSLIHPKWVLTSAYCTLPHSIVEVTLGALIPVDEEDPDRVVVQSDVIYIHPDYLPFYENPKNDVALIRLPRMTKSDAIIPIVLKRDSGPFPKENITLAAWGESGYETLTYTRYIQLFKGPCRCTDSDVKTENEDAALDSEFFCADSPEHFCFLHNGAGLVVNGAVVAVLSSRCFPHCHDHKGIFTNVYKHRQWIDNTMDSDSNPKVHRACSDYSIIVPGVYSIQPNKDVKPFEVYCDIADGKKWAGKGKTLNITYILDKYPGVLMPLE